VLTKFASTVWGVAGVPLAPGKVRVSQVAEDGLTVAVNAWFGLEESVLVTLTGCDAGAVPFCVALAVNPVSGLAVRPTALIVPVTATVPPPRISRVYVTVDEALMVVDPNELIEGVDCVSPVISVAVNASMVVPLPFTSLKLAVRVVKVPLVLTVRVPVLGIAVPQPMQLEPLRVTSTGVSGVYVPGPVSLSKIVVITPDVAPFLSFGEKLTLMVTDTG
jgi:hypothetical protein